jgi:perosamine synthetase
MVADPPWGTTNFQSCWVLLARDAPVTRDALLEELSRAGISARRGIMAAHLEPAYGDRPRVHLPETERLSADSLILPLFHQMTEAEQDRVVDVLHEALG